MLILSSTEDKLYMYILNYSRIILIIRHISDHVTIGLMGGLHKHTILVIEFYFTFLLILKNE